jgi:hypothetical protein
LETELGEALNDKDIYLKSDRGTQLVNRENGHVTLIYRTNKMVFNEHLIIIGFLNTSILIIRIVILEYIF